MTNARNIRTIGWRLLLLLMMPYFSVTMSYAQPERGNVYTTEHPLVYEDTWNLWPYSFLNDKGEPDGFNIELVKMLMDELGIPYVVRLKPLPEVLKDIKEHKADLTFGLAAGFHDDYGHFSRSTITLFTQSVATPKSNSIEIKTFRDLSKAKEKVYVYESSLCYHLIQDYGWAHHAQVSDNIKEVLETVSKTQKGQVLWNTVSLKWLIHQYGIKNLTLTPVNMPHGEYKFMSNNQHLLDMLDHVYTKLDSDDQFENLESKWFYPEYDEAETPEWVWDVLWLGLLLFGIALVYAVIYRIQNMRVTRANTSLHSRLALIHETSAVRIWTYHVKTQEFAWHDERGQVTHTYRPEEFALRYRKNDYKRLQDALDRLVTQHKDGRGHVEEELTLELRAKDIEGGDHEWHDFTVVMSVLERDKKGKPLVILGTKKDVTEKCRLKRLEDERTLRYWTIFYAPEGAIIEFDKDGYLHDINPKACELFQCDSDQTIKRHIHMNDFLHTSFSDLRQTDGFSTIQKYNEKTIEMKMKAVHQDDGQLLGIFAFCRHIVTTLLLLVFSAQVSAQALTDRYTKQRPVVIACDKNHSPYVFLDDSGEATGSDIDVIKAVMKQLDVPYTFLMKEYDEAKKVFNSTEADLILANEQSFKGKQYVISEDVFGYRRVSEDSVSEIHLIGRDRQLIEQIDDQYSRLKQSGDIAEIRAHWIHPEQMRSRPVSVMLYIAIGILVLAFVLYLLISIARRHVTMVTRNSKELNLMMYKALHMGNYDVMQYDIARNRFTNQYGNILPMEGMTLEEYTLRIHPEQRTEFVHKMRDMMKGGVPHFELNKLWNQGTDAEPHYLVFQGHAICERDKNGQPAYIINAVYDVTHDMEENQATRNLIRKYEVIMTNPFTAMAFYDSNHHVIDQNEAMKQLGDIGDGMPLQPLYNVEGEIANYFLAVSK